MVPAVPFLELLLGLGEALFFREPGLPFSLPFGFMRPAVDITAGFSDPVRAAAGSLPSLYRLMSHKGFPEELLPTTNPSRQEYSPSSSIRMQLQSL